VKIIKLIKVVSFGLIAGGLVSANAYAKDMDVTMDVVKQADAQNITDRVMKRIDLPESMQNAGTHGKKDQDRLHKQDRSRKDDGNHQMSSSPEREGDHRREDRQMRDGAHDAMEGKHKMGARDDSHQMRDDASDARNDSHQMRSEVNDARDDSQQMRDDVNDTRDDVQQMRDKHGMN